MVTAKFQLLSRLIVSRTSLYATVLLLGALFTVSARAQTPCSVYWVATMNLNAGTFTTALEACYAYPFNPSFPHEYVFFVAQQVGGSLAANDAEYLCGHTYWDCPTGPNSCQSGISDPDPTFYVLEEKSFTCPNYWVTATAPAQGQTCSLDCVGDPLNPGGGNVYKKEEDVEVEGASPLKFARYYNSADTLGFDNVAGWRHSYDQYINVVYQPTAGIYPGESATVSAEYSTASSACVSGFGAIKSSVSNWASATASYANGVCVITNGSATLGTLPINVDATPLYSSSPLEYDAVRADGQIVRFPVQNGTIVSPTGIPLTFTVTASGFTVTDDQDNVETYNSAGVLQSITSRAGVVQAVAYDTNGRLSGVTDSFGNLLAITRDGSEHIRSVAVNSATSIQYTYAASLASVEYQDGTNRSYTYGNMSFPSALTAETDEAGNQYSTWGYDSLGRAASSQEALGADATTLTYNSNGTVAVTDALGAVRTFTYARIGAVNGVASISGSQCATCLEGAATTYDNAGWIASRTDYNGNVTCYGNDPVRGLELVRVEGFAPGSTCPTNLSSYTPASGTVQRKISTAWGTSYRLPTLITEAARTTAFDYDGSGNLLSKTITDTTVTPNVSRTWSYTYNAYGQVLTAKGPRTDVNSTTTYTYYSCTTGSQCGELNTVTDPVGNVTTYDAYSAYGKPLSITDPNAVATTLTYDARARLTSRQIESETTSFSYYPTGLLETVTQPDASTITYSYDTAHRLTKMADGAGNYINYTLDALGNRTAEQSYDPSSTLHRTHTRVFNALSELYQDIDAADTSAVTTTYGYDSNANQTTIDAPLARNTVNSFDALNRLSKITDPNSGLTQFAYDAEDDLTSVEDPRSLTTSYGYNGFGDMAQIVSPDSGTSTNRYDSGGNLSIATDARGAMGHYTYDAANRATRIIYKNSSSVADQKITFGYDAGTYGKGRLTNSGDANHALAWTYDFAGRLIEKDLTVGSVKLSIGYSYTDADLTAITTPSGQLISYGYNSNHQITSIKVGSTTVLSAVTYEPFGGVNGWTWGDGTTVSRTFNGDGLISEIVTAGVTHAYTFDDANRITAISDSSSKTLSWAYGYDLLDRLTSASTSAKKYGWAYDANGNRTAQTGTNATTFTVSTTSNQLADTSGTLARAYVYDAAGHTAAYGGISFSYNNRGRMSSTSSDSMQYLYNALGQLYKKKAGSGATTYLMYDEAGHLIGEYKGAGKLVEETVWLGDIPVATLRSNGSTISIYYVHSDHLNTPRKVTQPTTDTLAWRWDTDPFGMAAPNQDPGKLGSFVYNLRLPGQYYQSETGLNQNLNRDYDPFTGAYTQSDPIGLSTGSRSTYAYVSGNPVSSFDPSGLECTSTGNFIYCTYDGGPSFRVPAQSGFPASLGADDFMDFLRYHRYDESVPLNGADAQCVMKKLIANPTPGNPRPATPNGTRNNAVVLDQNNWVTSYLTSNIDNGDPVVVNVTDGKSLFSPGYTARTVSNGYVHTYGEGEAWSQAVPLLPGAGNWYYWKRQMERMVEECSCGK